MKFISIIYINNGGWISVSFKGQQRSKLISSYLRGRNLDKTYTFDRFALGRVRSKQSLVEAKVI